MPQSSVVFLISIMATVLLCCVPITKSEDDDNATPIVGILTQEVTRFIRKKFPDRNLTSYIAASYVKFVEGSGARAVPIWIRQSADYYKDIVKKVNGVLLPGGGALLAGRNGYADASQQIYKAAVKLNDEGTYFPLWGTCLGFEMLIYLDGNRTDHRSACSSNKQPLPLEFKEGYENSRMFRDAPEDIISILRNKNVTANFHKYCLTEDTFKNEGYDKNWDVLSVNHDWKNFEFISSIEHKKYPFYGIQFHPEKNLYEFIKNHGIPHSMPSIRAAQYFADFFIKESRKNSNNFPDSEDENNNLIYNFQPEFSGKLGGSFVQEYLFDGTNTARSLLPSFKKLHNSTENEDCCCFV